jgi:glycosyltransferase involved in cell wall biosynthesis
VDAPDYSIVVPAYNEEHFLGPTLASLRAAMASERQPGEIVVCDNNSTDRTGEVARSAGARVAFEPVNPIARARNAGARAARGRFLLFVDADTLIPPELLVAALDCLRSGRACGGGSTVRLDGADPSCLAARLVRLWNRFSRWRKLAAGSFLFVTREAFEAVGGFSVQVYASEEIWLSRALGRWGRPRGLDFTILDGHPPVTSNRKVDWFPAAAILGSTLILLLFPFALRSRRLCWFWYRRPAPLSSGRLVHDRSVHRPPLAQRQRHRPPLAGPHGAGARGGATRSRRPHR